MGLANDSVWGSLAAALLAGLALASAALLTYGVHPQLGAYAGGIELILTVRRLQFILIAISIVSSMGLLVLVIAGQRRSWWLLLLAPVLALFGVKFRPDPANDLRVVDRPTLVLPSHPAAPPDDDQVVGIVFNNQPYALPYRYLYRAPAVFIADREHRLMVVWSAYANRSLAVRVSNELRARDVEIVSSPANALLLYNRRLGQFINGVTGTRPNGQTPAGVVARLPTYKLSWGAWKSMHPRSLVPPMEAWWADSPPVALMPRYDMLGQNPGEADRLVAMLDVPTSTPIALSGRLRAGDLVNSNAAPELPVVAFRDPGTGLLQAFDRRLPDGQVPTFDMRRVRGWSGYTMVDSITGSAWTMQGEAVSGPMRGQSLRPIALDASLPLSVMRFWHPGLVVLGDAPPIRTDGSTHVDG